MSVEPEAFKAAILYSAVSQRYGTVLNKTGVYDLSEVDAKISIRHGENDDVISVEQPQELCQQLQILSKNPLCEFYEGQPHTFYRDQWADPLLMERTLQLYDRNVHSN
jgi:dienelactone hydrolase